jgi:ABC-2 type transport system ATP-binding protein
MSPALVLNGVTKRMANRVVVDNVSLSLDYGSVCGFLGQNGAGKTTTIRMIMGILQPDAGTISILGRGSAVEVRRELGYLPEERGLYSSMTVGNVLEYFGQLKGMSAADARLRGTELLDEVGLREHIKSRCGELSKGMAQKVQLLAAILHGPKLVVLDEPFSGLDPVNVEVMRRFILRMKQQGQTVIFSTHVMEQAEQICDSVFMIRNGRQVLSGSLNEVKATGAQSIQIDYDGDGAVLAHLSGVERVNDAGRHAELSLKADTDPQTILAALVGRLKIRRFDLCEPSLHEIFVRASGELPT